MNKEPITAVPTNIITGFLGVGKTTLIQKLLADKPKDERWAILVNEFGEVGIDGALLSGDNADEVYIKEVPGGCMCCTSGLPMQIALNMLLARARPHRLLIEPTGLGHPTEVLATLSAEHYKSVLDLRATITLIDARKVSDKRYSEHATFREQLRIADVIYASKADLYSSDDLGNLKSYLNELGLSDTQLQQSGEKSFDLSLLSTVSGYGLPESEHHHHHALDEGTADIDELVQTQGWARVCNEGEGFVSYGWVFSSTRIFEYQKIISALSYLEVERLKAVMITDNGVFAFNFADGILSHQEVDEAHDSRLEFIAADVDLAKELASQLEAVLLGND